MNIVSNLFNVFIMHLQKHISIHHKPSGTFQCPYCTRTYNHSSGVRKHINRNHRIEDEQANAVRKQAKLSNLMKLEQKE